jgi:hypothetical protein
MFKYHSQKKYGAPNIIDGWIVKFFPYDKDGKRNNLDELIGGGSLPEEIVKVDLKFIKTDGIHSKETLLELWTGFIGLEQNAETFALTPKISWMIKIKDTNQTAIHQKLESENIPSSVEGGIELMIKDVPESLRKFKEIYALSLHFKNNVLIPEWLKDIRIGRLKIEGKIDGNEKDKIINWFPNTELTINNKEYNKGKKGWVLVSGNTIPIEVLELKEIWILEIWNMEDAEDKLIIPDALKEIRIDNLSLVNYTSRKNIEKIRELLPKTNLYVQGKKITNAR